MTNDDTQELLAGLLRGANINQLNILTGEHAHVSYLGGGSEAVSDDQQQVVDRLKPFFFGVEEEARAFFMQIQGMKATLLTQDVRSKMADGRSNSSLLTLNSSLGITFHMFPDRDAPGERLFLQLQKVLPTLQHHQLPPDCKDFSDYYLTHLRKPP